MAYELGAGVAIGIAVGTLGSWLLRRVALPAAGLYPLAAVAFTILAYASGAVVHASGFIAVYAAGVILGNSRLPHRQAILGFADGIAWLSQIGLFVLLGLLASPSRLPGVILPAIVIGMTLVILARPASVFASALPFMRGPARVGVREQVFLSWAGLRGAVPIVFATIPLSMAVPGAERLFDAIFVLVVIFTLVQASTLPPVARMLRVTAAAEPSELRVETAPLERMRADLLQLDVPNESALVGVHLDELRLPSGAVVTMVQRGESGFVPTPNTRIKAGDGLLIVAADEVRDATVRRLRAVSRRGRLARWFGENGADVTD
jgi:cell volume regulation protein A